MILISVLGLEKSSSEVVEIITTIPDQSTNNMLPKLVMQDYLLQSMKGMKSHMFK